MSPEPDEIRMLRKRWIIEAVVAAVLSAVEVCCAVATWPRWQAGVFLFMAGWLLHDAQRDATLVDFVSKKEKP